VFFTRFVLFTTLFYITITSSLNLIPPFNYKNYQKPFIIDLYIEFDIYMRRCNKGTRYDYLLYLFRGIFNVQNLNGDEKPDS